MTLSVIVSHWLPVDYRIIYKMLLSVYEAINGFSPSYNPICSAFVVAPTTLCVPRISYFKSQDLTLSLIAIHDFLLQDLSYGIAYLYL